MKKINALWIVLSLIFPLVFNAIFFVAGGTEHKPAVWITYGFIHFSYLMLLLTPFLIRNDRSSAVFGFTLYTTTACYFLVELAIGGLFVLAPIIGLILALLIVGGLCILILLFGPKMPLLIISGIALLIIGGFFMIPLFGTKSMLVCQLIITGIYGVMLVGHMIANEKTADAQQARQPQIAYIKNASMQLKSLLGRVQDKETQRRLERVYDTLNSSPVKSYPEFERMEKGILSAIDAIDHAVSAGNKETIMSLADSLLKAINERNMRLRQHHP